MLNLALATARMQRLIPFLILLSCSHNFAFTLFEMNHESDASWCLLRSPVASTLRYASTRRSSECFQFDVARYKSNTSLIRLVFLAQIHPTRTPCPTKTIVSR